MWCDVMYVCMLVCMYGMVWYGNVMYCNVL